MYRHMIVSNNLPNYITTIKFICKYFLITIIFFTFILPKFKRKEKFKYMDNKKYVSLTRLSDFLAKLRESFSESGHKHTTSEITDYVVDGEFSSTSTNPIQNCVVNTEFDAMAAEMERMESRIQTKLDGKASTSHGTHVTFSFTAPLMDGTASVGSGSYVARSNHRHPTDTTRAAKTDLDNLTTVVSGKADAEHTHDISDITGVTTTTEEINYLDGVTSGIQAQIDSKQSTITGAATTITGSNLTANRALISNASGKIAVSSTITSTELGYLDGVTSNIQTQLNAKANSSVLSSYYTKTEIDEMEFITLDDIDAICGTTIQVASLSEVTF